MGDLDFKSNMRGPVAIISSAQNITTSWANLGSEMSLQGVTDIALYLTIDINAGANVRVRLLALHTSGGTGHVLPIPTTSASDVKVEDHYVEFNDDADQNIVVAWEPGGLVPFGQFQVIATDAGSTAQIDAASVVTAQR